MWSEAIVPDVIGFIERASSSSAARNWISLSFDPEPQL